MEFRLRRPPFWTTRFAFLLAALFFGAWWMAQGAEPGSGGLRWWLILAAGLVLAGIVLAVRALEYRRPPASIVVRPDGLVLPRTLGGSRSFFTPWRSLHTLELRGQADRTFLLVGTKRKTLLVPAYALERSEDLLVLHAAVIEGIAQQPRGHELLERMRRGREATRALVEQRPRVTRALLIAIGVAYVIQTLAADPDDPLGLAVLVELGGNVSALVWEGQIDRLITANFLHAPMAEGVGLLHIGLNALGIWLLGGLMERLLGHGRYFVIYIVSAVTGAAASAAGAEAPVSVGASTGLLGLFGALAVVHIAHLRAIPPAVRQPLRWWLIIIGINAVLSLAVPNIDHWGHGGGLVGGMVTTFLLTLRWPPLHDAPRGERITRVIAYALLAMTALGLGVSGWRAAFGGGTDIARLGLQQLEVAEPDPVMLNYYAWMIAIRADASRRDLEAAARMAERAMALEPDSREIIDTLAQAEWRLGNVDRAVELERRALTQEAAGTLRGTYATQLARFLEHRVKSDGPIVLGDEVPELEVDVRNDVLHTTMRGEAPATGMVAYVVVERGDPVPWLLRLRLGPDARPPESTELDENWPEGMRAHVALVDTTVEVPRGIDWQVDEYPPADDVAELP